MEFKSQGVTNQAQFSSYVVSFTTQHTDSYEVNLDKGPKNQQFSGISANIYSYQNGYYSMMSSLYGEQRALDPAGALVEAKKIIPHWGDVKPYMDKIKQDYLNNAQINVLRNKILNNITDTDAVNNIITEGNSLNDAMKKLGNSIGQYDRDGSFAGHKEDTTKASDRYKYAKQNKQEAYDNATEVTKALINKDTGTYADQETVEKLTEAENNAWSALDGVKPDAEKTKPNVPATPVPVANTSSLTEGEKDQVKTNVTNANKDKFPAGTEVTVGDDGTATVTYPDGSKDTITGDQLVQGQKGDTTDADKITPTVPGDKVTVKDPSHLTDDEKNQVKNNVDNANKDKFPAGTTVTVGDNGTATVTYPDGSKDTIPGSDLVRQSTDADKTTPSVPETKVPVADPSHLTDSEKDQVKTNVTDANKDNLPSGSQITVGNDGTTTVTYPDGSKDTIPGDKVLEGKSDVKSDADKNEPKEPGDKVKVDDPNKLTDSEKEELSNNLEKLNPGTVVTIADDGTATLTYPDGSTNTIPGSQLVTAKGNGNTTNSNVKVTPTNTNNKINKDNNSLGKNTANAKAGELPQTGETNDSQKLSVIGMALMGILGLFGLGKKRKKD